MSDLGLEGIWGLGFVRDWWLRVYAGFVDLVSCALPGREAEDRGTKDYYGPQMRGDGD